MTGPTQVKIRRTVTANKVPTTSEITIGELSFNTTDRKAFTSDGSNVFEIGANVTSKSIGSNSTVNGIQQTFIRVTTSAAATINVDSWAIATWRCAHYQASVVDNNANNYLVASASMLYDGSVATVEVFGVLYTNTYMGTFNATSNATHAILQFTPVSTNTTLSISKTTITV